MSKAAGYAGTVDELAEVLKPFFTKADFFKYPEKASEKFQLKLITPHASMFKELSNLHPTLVFQKLKMQSALDSIFDELNDSWPSPIKTTNKKEYIVSMTSRIRVACMHVGKTLRKTVKPGWACKLFGEPHQAKVTGTGGEDDDESEEEEESEEDNEEEGEEEEEGEGEEDEDAGEEEENGEGDEEEEEDEDEEEEEEEEEGSEEATKGKAQQTSAIMKKPAAAPAARDKSIIYVYGYDFETRRAWRAPSDKPSHKEFTLVCVPKNAEPTDYPTAKWGADTWSVTDITVAEYEAGNRAREPQVAGLWHSQVVSTLSNLKIVQAKTKNGIVLQLHIKRTNTDGDKKPKEQLCQIELGKNMGATETERKENGLRVLAQLGDQIAKGAIDEFDKAAMKQFKATASAKVNAAAPSPADAAAGAAAASEKTSKGGVKKRPASALKTNPMEWLQLHNTITTIIYYVLYYVCTVYIYCFMFY